MEGFPGMEHVYKYRHYDIHSDDYVYATRYATMGQINRIGGEPIYGTAAFLDRKHLKDGWTEKDFNPAKIKESGS